MGSRKSSRPYTEVAEADAEGTEEEEAEKWWEVGRPAGRLPHQMRVLPYHPATMHPRRPTRQISVGDARTGIIKIGGGLPDKHGNPTTPAPVSVQTMTAGYTHDIEKCVAEINKLAAAGADIVRVAVPEKKDTDALKEILPRVQVPIVADVHFHFQRRPKPSSRACTRSASTPATSTTARGDRCDPGVQGPRPADHIGVNEGSIIEPGQAEADEGNSGRSSVTTSTATCSRS